MRAVRGWAQVLLALESVYLFQTNDRGVAIAAMLASTVGALVFATLSDFVRPR